VSGLVQDRVVESVVAVHDAHALLRGIDAASWSPTASMDRLLDAFDVHLLVL